MKNIFVLLVVIAILGLVGACSEESYVVSTENTPEISTAEAAFFQKGNASQKDAVLRSEWVEELFIDYRPDRDSHAGPGPHPTTESSDFHLTQGGIRWFSDVPVEYTMGTEAVSGGNAAIELAFATWDVFVTTRTFMRNDVTTQINPCTGNANTVQWAEIDGAGDVLATASVCRNVVTKEIGGFVITMDSEESWATDGSSGNFDVENVSSHEVGHVAGLGHDNPPKSGCLTMYKFAAKGETQKQTLGLGDKLGMDALYGPVNTDAGSCGS